MQSCFQEVASLESVPIQLNKHKWKNMCFQISFWSNEILNIFLPYIQLYRQISDITSPLFLRCVNQFRPLVDKAVARQRLYSLIRAYTVASSFTL